MTRRRALVAGALAALLPAALAKTAAAHTGDPGYRSIVRGITPAAPGLTIQVLNYDDQLRLVNQTHHTVQINGYENEPYVRILPDGTVEQNQNSPATYTNEERFGGTAVPVSATPKAAPNWKVIDDHGQFVWHDHRMHWMSHTMPPAVRDKHAETKVFDYHVPLLVGGQQASIDGELFWTGIPKGKPVLWFGGLAIVAAGLMLFARARIRRRGGRSGPDPGDLEEAW